MGYGMENLISYTVYLISYLWRLLWGMLWKSPYNFYHIIESFLLKTFSLSQNITNLAMQWNILGKIHVNIIMCVDDLTWFMFYKTLYVNQLSIDLYKHNTFDIHVFIVLGSYCFDAFRFFFQISALC